MVFIIRRHWPLAVALASLWLLIATLLAASLAGTDANVVYALDDPYIHMAMAKNLVRHGVLGVTRYEFTSTTSAPLWTLLVALLFAVFGVRDEIPLLINLASASAVVVLAYRLIDVRSSSQALTCGILLCLIFVTPLPALVLSGTEHVLQILLCLAFAGVVARVVSGFPAPAAAPAWLYVLAPLATAVRYEALFLVSVAALLLASRRYARQAVIMAVLACMPGLLYGMFSAAHGWPWLPTPLLIKGAFPRHIESLSSLADYLSRGLLELAASPPLLGAAAIMAIAAVLAADRRLPSRRNAEAICLALLFGGATLLHVQFARLGSFYRYEAYLIALGVLGSGFCVVSWLRQRGRMGPIRGWRSAAARGVAVAVLLFLALPLGRRALAALVNTPRATRNIYQQQVQMGRFLQRLHPGERVAINDIGAVNYLADVRSLDLWGLADIEVSQLRRDDRYSTDDIRRLAAKHAIGIAVVYDSGFAHFGGLPSEWIKVGEWEIRDNFICAAATVSFLAVDPTAVARLKRELERFAGELPDEVVVRLW